MRPRGAEWYRAIHERLLAADPTAPAELAEVILGPLKQALVARNPRIGDQTLLDDAVADALIDYIKKPERFDPDKAGLFGYLEMAAQADLKNALAKRRRRRTWETPLDEVEVDTLRGKKEANGTDIVDALEAERIRRLLDEHFTDPKDRQMVDLIIDKERSTQAFAAILGIEGLPVDEQRRQVKRHKDRIKKRLKQLGQRIREEQR